MNIILFGPPGAGKGTQSALLVEHLNMLQISTGDLFRTAMKNDSELGKKAKAYVNDGQLVPDEIVIGLVDEVLKTLGGKSFILDGFPRTVPQAKALEKQVSAYDLVIERALFLEVPRADLLMRLAGRRVCKACGTTFHVDSRASKVPGMCDVCGGEVEQRKDDREDVVQTRLQAYEKSTSPLRDHYRDTGIYCEVNGVGGAEEVFARLKECLV